MTENLNITFVGGGNMARSLIGGLIDGGTHPARITACDPQPKCLASLAADFHIKTSDDNQFAVSNCDIVVLAVKPQQMKPVLQALANSLYGKLIISIAAGVRCDAMQRWGTEQATDKLALVRCMPNTPALLQAGATALYAEPIVTTEQRSAAERILCSAGSTAWVESESALDAITALSGSGPAYFFLLIESMINAATDLGLPESLATEFAIQTALGAARMAKEGEISPAQLRRNVTSPGGTTQAALASFEQQSFANIVSNAMQAANARAYQLGNELGND